VRATTAFNKILSVPGADVVGVTFTPAGVVVDLRRRARRLSCPCGWSTRAVYDRSVRRWRGLDLGAARLFLRAEIRRLDCRCCGRVRTEDVPWARPGGRFSRDFEDVVAWLAQRMDKTAVSRLLRCSWEAVAGIVTRVVADHLDDARLDAVYRIGVDEVSYRKGHRYLTVVADHDRDGAVIWAGEGKSGATLERFFEQLGSARSTQIQAAWADLHGGYARVIARRAPQARLCADPFHVIKIANLAVDEVRRTEWNAARTAAGVTRVSPLWRTRQNPAAQLTKHTRWALLKDPATWTEQQREQIAQLRKARHVLFRAWVLKEELRDLYRLPPGRRPDAHLDAWLARASRSRIPAVVDLPRTVRKHREAILAAVDLGLSNSKLEGLNSKIRLINDRGYGHHTPAAVIAMIYLCCSGLTIPLPTGR
jgi:transposase